MAHREIALPSSLAALPREPVGMPSVVIVGRPNVGKSCLLNCLARKRIAIVDPTAGVTRDRISAIIEHQKRVFELWDTGGIGAGDDLAAEVQMQIEVALSRADLVLFVVDAQEGLLPFDQEIAARLRKIDRRILLVANKVEHQRHEETAVEFEALGFGKPVLVSALQSFGRTDLLDEIVRLVPETHAVAPEPVMKVAIVGRQNVGKSTLINTLAREERVIVSETPGTTRDAVDVRFERKGRVFVAVDTAGVKRRGKVADSIEFYSLERAFRAIRRCDVVLLLIDATQEISRLDRQLASDIEQEFKPCVLTVNKWDLAKGKMSTEGYLKYLNAHLPMLSYAPVSFICGKTGFNVGAAIDLAESLFEQSRQEVSTGRLNQVLQRAEEANPPGTRHNKRPRLYYATQVGVAPPTFLVFASYPQLITEQYTRFLMNHLRSHLGFEEIPVRTVFRARERREMRGGDAPKGRPHSLTKHLRPPEARERGERKR